MNIENFTDSQVSIYYYSSAMQFPLINSGFSLIEIQRSLTWTRLICVGKRGSSKQNFLQNIKMSLSPIRSAGQLCIMSMYTNRNKR